MKSFGPIFFLLVFLLAELGSEAAPSASPPADSIFLGMGHTSAISPSAPENSTQNRPDLDLPETAYSESSQRPPAVSPETSPLGFTETPGLDFQETPKSPEIPKLDLLTTPVSDSLDCPQTNPSKVTQTKPFETPKPDLIETPHPGPSETPKPYPSETSHPQFPETPDTDPTQTVYHQASPESPQLTTSEITEAKTPNPDPESLGIHEPDTTETPKSGFPLTIHPTENSHPESHVTHNISSTEIPQTEFPTTHLRDTTEIPITSDPGISTSLHPAGPAASKVEVTAGNELHLNPTSGSLRATQPDSALPTSVSPGDLDLTSPQNSGPKGPDTPPPSARIAGPPAPQGSPSQLAPDTPRGPQRHPRGERVNTIIVVERVKETGVTLVGRPRGGTGGALCLFFAGTGLLIVIFLLMWCLYRRAAQHRPFAHHRLPDSGDEPVMHLDTPKDPYDLYFYAPDAWVPSHIATKGPPPTPPLPPKLPPPPRGGRPQRLEALSPATLPNNFV